MRPVLTLTLGSLLVGCAAPSTAIPTAAVGTRSQLSAQGSQGVRGTTAAQALLGASFYDDMTFSRTDPMDPTTTIESDVSTMPALGIAGHHRLFGNPRGFEGGLDGSLLFSWARDSTSVISSGGGNEVVSISTTMFITDIGFGMYISQMLGDSARLYLGAGPLVQFGDAEFEDELTEIHESGFGVGVYGRGGIEFRIKPGEFLGIGLRATYSEIDFGGSTGDINSDALQVFLTYTMQL